MAGGLSAAVITVALTTKVFVPQIENAKIFRTTDMPSVMRLYERGSSFYTAGGSSGYFVEDPKDKDNYIPLEDK